VTLIRRALTYVTLPGPDSGKCASIGQSYVRT